MENAPVTEPNLIDPNAPAPAPAPTADFSFIRYAQVWEDADVLIRGLGLNPGAQAFSIASAGDNAFAMLTARPGRVVALDMNPAQLACVGLRKAAYQELEHAEFLELMGGKPSTQREALYQRCRPLMAREHQAFWDANPALIRLGAATQGKFERYFEKFRKVVLPLVQSRKNIETVLSGLPRKEREEFYDKHWNSWKWQGLFRIFFSRKVMGAMGRDPSFFKYVQGPVAERILERAKYALTELNPAENPYLQWILTGEHRTALPMAWRPEHYEVIRENVENLEIVQASLGDWLRGEVGSGLSGYNLSDLFEYLSESDFHQMLELILATARPGARLVYWNMLAPRRRPDYLADRLEPLTLLSDRLFAEDKAFFYSALIIEEVKA